MYSSEQVNAVKEYLKTKFFKGEIESLELVTTLLAMHRAEKITEDDAANIVLDVYMGNAEGALRALTNASKVISDNDIDQILINLEKKRHATQEK